MEHFARWIVKRRKLILVLAVLLLIPSVFGALGTYINYDILTYLPKDLDSMIGETYLEDDFNMASVSMITVENMSTPDTLKLKSDLEGVEGVQKVMWTSDFIDVTTPKEMLPSDIQKFFYNDSGATMLIVQFDAPSADARTMNAQKQIKNILNKDCFIGGMSAILEDTKSLINKEMPLYILCAVGASLLILFLSLKETIVPLTLANGTENLLENAQLLATKTGELSLGAIQLQNSTAQLAGVMNQQLVPGLVEASEKKTALEDKMTELSGKLETVEIPDMTALKAQLGAGVEQVFDGAASGAAEAASEAAASNAATAASQKTAEAIKGSVQAASSSEDVTNAAAALTTQLYQGGYSAGYQTSKAYVEAALNNAELGLNEQQKAAILATLEQAEQASTSTPSAEVIGNVTAQVSGMVTKIASGIDPDAIASVVAPQVTEKVAPAVTEKVTTSEKLAAAKQSAVQQVAAAIPDINTDELKNLMGEFKDLSSQAGEMMDSVDTLTGALYNAENPADTDTVVGAANAISDGAAKLGSGASQLATGTSAFATGVGTLDAGTNQLLGGMETLSSSSKTVSNAIGQFQTGGAELKDGTSELSDGMTEFSDTINDKLDDLSEITDPDSTLARVIDIMKDRADSFKGSGRADGTDMTVSYVMRTATDSSSNSTSTTEETTTETETKDSFWNRVANLFSK